MGLGDVKLLALIGAFGGWAVSIVSIFLGAVFGSVWGIGAIIAQHMHKSRKTDTATDEENIGSQDRITRLLSDDGEAAKRRGWTFEASEKTVIARLAREAAGARTSPSHHLPFGPHLALAAYLLVLFEPQVMRYLLDFFAPVIEYYTGG